MWFDPGFADLSLLAMARARRELVSGQLVTQTAAIEDMGGPRWLAEHLRARRRGNPIRSPRLRTAALAWRDAR